MILCLVLLSGCAEKTDENGSKKSKDGRSYGGEIKVEEGTVVSTAFFDMTIDESVKYETFQFADGPYQPEEGNTYLVVTFKIKNTYDTELHMSITDFPLNYEGADEDKIMGYGKDDLELGDYMDNEFTLSVGEIVTRKILYTVPDKEEYTLSYSEYYEDGFTGDKYLINLKPIKRIEEAIDNTETEDTED